MRIKKITLQNIRSYEYQEIEFPEGSTLLSGDIGSGKTSILLGIEFALFGLQPGQRGNSLLSNREKNGSVKMEFEIDGKNVIIERALKRGKTVSQDYTSIIIDGEKKELSVTELKNKILELLSYPKEFARKQNILYKFTVYTPQEEMKQIILQDSATRINTLRHVFGIDKYKKILENSSVVLSKIREEKRINEAVVSNLEQDKFDLKSKENELKLIKSDMDIIEGEIAKKINKKDILQLEVDEISQKIEERKKLQQEIEKTHIIILNKKDTVISNKKFISEIQQELSELEKVSFNEKQLFSIEKEINLIKGDIENLREENLQITSQINSLKLKNEEYKELEMKLSNLEICPTCLQNVDAVYRANVLNKIRTETNENTKQIEVLESKKEKIKAKIYSGDEQLIKKRDKLQELKVIKLRLNEINIKKQKIVEIEKYNTALSKDIELLEKHIITLKESSFKLKKFENLMQIKQDELRRAMNDEKISEIKLAELKKEIELLSSRIEELNAKIKKTEEIKEKIKYLAILENWLSSKFIPLISFVEKNVMTKLKSEFSQLFSEWFAMLVSDSFNVFLREDFTPVIEHQDYELDYSYLSGGERTAIALAYRLALTQVINSMLSKIKTKDIVILDEPTDGFSEQQLDKMRDVLQQLNVNQLIIVSHEQKIEGFVENVIKLKKENDISKVKCQ